MNTNRIARFEAIVQRLVEGTFARLFAGRLRPLEVANALAHALEDHAVSQPDEPPLAPNHYWVALNPTDYDALLAQQPNLAADLARHLFDLAREAGFALLDPPAVNLSPHPDVALHRIQVNARRLPAEEEKTDEISDSTRQMPLSADQIPGTDQPPPTSPFLILEGQRHIQLLKTTVSLGRSLDNDVIVDDARVSRHHAQLRQRYDRYVIYDLGSTGGTTVNGYPVQECVLEAGDVISLAGLEIIYGEDRPTPAPLPREAGSTPVMPASSLRQAQEADPRQAQDGGLLETKELPSASIDHSEA